MTKKSNRILGWWVSYLLCLTLIAATSLMFTPSVWALDFESSIQRQEASNQEIVAGLGQGRDAESSGTSSETRRTVHVQLIRKSKSKSKSKLKSKSLVKLKRGNKYRRIAMGS